MMEEFMGTLDGWQDQLLPMVVNYGSQLLLALVTLKLYKDTRPDIRAI